MDGCASADRQARGVRVTGATPRRWKRRSILFVRPDLHCSFHYRAALRELGWKADIYVNHGYPEQLLYSHDDILQPPRVPGGDFLPSRIINLLLFLLWWHLRVWRYDVLLYYGRPPALGHWERRLGLRRLFGEDFVYELWYARLVGCLLVYLPTGCLDNDLKSTWMQLEAGNICGNCGSFDRCDDVANSLNFRRIRRYFAFAIGNDSEAKASRELVERRIKYKAIDLDKWKPDLEIPERFRLPPTTKIRVLHSNFLKKSGRAWQGRNIKGSPFVAAAVERLAAEGHPVELLSIEDVPSRDMRFYQAQADIVVEQLIYGWWGSTGVETMALGKPVVCHIRPSWKQFFLATFPEYTDLPIVEADVHTVYDALKRLVVDAAYRAERGRASRRFAEAHFNPAANALALAELLQTA